MLRFLIIKVCDILWGIIITGSQGLKQGNPLPVFVIFRVIAMIINFQYRFFQSSIINFVFSSTHFDE